MLGRVKPGIRFDYSKATTDHLRAAIHTVIIA